MAENIVKIVMKSDVREKMISELNSEILKKYLFDAINKSDATSVANVIRQGANVFEGLDEKSSFLHDAVLKNQREMVEIILNSVAREKVKELVEKKVEDEYKYTALHIATNNRSLKLALILLRFGANFEARDSQGRKPIDLLPSEDYLYDVLVNIQICFDKVKRNETAILSATPAREFLKDCDDETFTAVANSRNTDGFTLFQLMFLNNHEKMCIDFLLNRLAKSPQTGICKSSGYETIVSLVKDCKNFYTDNLELFKNLSGREEEEEEDAKAAANKLKIWCEALKKVRKALLVAQRFQSMAMSLTYNALLLSVEETLAIVELDSNKLRDITPDQCHYEKRHSLSHHVVAKIIHESIQFLECGTSNRSALCYGAEKGNERVVSFVLDSGVAQVMRNDAISPIYLAAKEGHAKVVKILLKSLKTDDIPDAIDSRMIVGSTALHAAAEKGHLAAVKTLLSFGAKYSIRDSKNRTPLDVSHSKEVRKLLKKVNKFFHEAEMSDKALVHKLLAVKEVDEFLAISGARNVDGLTLSAMRRQEHSTRSLEHEQESERQCE